MEINKNLKDELTKIFNTKEGKRFKQEIENTDKAKLEELLKGVDFSKIDINEVNEKLSNESPESLENKLKIMLNRYLRR